MPLPQSPWPRSASTPSPAPPRPPASSAQRHLLRLSCAAAVLLTPTVLRAQTSNDELFEALREALATIAALEQRVEALEAANPAQDPLEAQLQRLIGREGSAPPRRTVFPSSLNPRIGVFMDAVATAGNVKEAPGENADRFSLRETEVDFRLPVSPFAEGVLIAAFEDAGSGEFESLIEEGYADIALGTFFDNPSASRAKLGRFRVPFGHDNKLHTHDLLQVDRPVSSSRHLGEEGLIGDGIEVTIPLGSSESDDGLGQATTLQLAVVNGEALTGEEGALGAAFDGTGVDLASDAPILVARASHFVELGERSDLEFGASYLDGVSKNAITTSTGGEVTPRMFGVDATWRQRDDESGVGSWLVSAEFLQSDFGYRGPSVFEGKRQRGASVTAQRQLTPSVYAGLRVGKTDELGTGVEVKEASPYVSWYADEFFRLRVQGQHLEMDPGRHATRVFLQASWNFGAHSTHPYWTNR